MHVIHQLGGKLLMPDLMLIGGEKGGVGKSMICRTVAQYLLDHGHPFIPFDTDRSNPDLMRIYGKVTECRLAVFSEGERYEDTANQIYNAAITNRVLVNLPAQVFIPMKTWFVNNDLFEIAVEDEVRFILFFVCDGGFDSLNLLGKSLEHFGGKMHHVVVRNWGKCDDWEPLETDQRLQKLIKKHKVPVIDFPKFIGNTDRNRIDAENWTFGEARDSAAFSSISRQRVKKFLREAYTSLMQAGVLP
jgi:hypothetical protein